MPFVELMAKWQFGRWLASDILARIETREMQLWAVVRGNDVRGVIVTEVINFPRKRVGHLFGVAGIGIRDWLYVRHELRAWAKAQGCVEMQVEGRLGWKRLLTDYKPTGMIYTRSV